MGKQKLTHKKVEVIKHLLFNKPTKARDISNLVDTGIRNVNHIRKNERWIEVSTPTYERGEMLYYMLINKEEL